MANVEYLRQHTSRSVFVKQEVDTVIIVGCTTSGCVRASLINASSYGFRVMMPEDCVAGGPHFVNWQNVGRRYEDIVDLQTCLNHIAGLPRVSH